MHSQANEGVRSGKITAIFALYAVAILITLAGVAFCAYSLIFDVQLPVLQTQVPGAVFGAVIAFLGVRYVLAVGKLKAEVYKPTSRFSWRNFKKAKG